MIKSRSLAENFSLFTIVTSLALALVGSAGAFLSRASAQTDPGFNCVDPQAQQEMNYCAAKNFEEADAELNAVYKMVRAVMAEMDANVETYNPELKGAVKALIKAQRGWIEYRDGHCEAYGFESRGGSMEPMLVAGCLEELTRTRTKELQSLIDDQAN